MGADNFNIYLKKSPSLYQLLIYRRRFIVLEGTAKYIYVKI